VGGLDPTNNRQPDGHYVKVAVGRDYADVSRSRGTYRGTAKRQLTVEVLVTRLEELEPGPRRDGAHARARLSAQGGERCPNALLPEHSTKWSQSSSFSHKPFTPGLSRM